GDGDLGISARPCTPAEKEIRSSIGSCNARPEHFAHSHSGLRSGPTLYQQRLRRQRTLRGRNALIVAPLGRLLSTVQSVATLEVIQERLKRDARVADNRRTAQNVFVLHQDATVHRSSWA